MRHLFKLILKLNIITLEVSSNNTFLCKAIEAASFIDSTHLKLFKVIGSKEEREKYFN
jgi:hypothetical protein